MDGHRHWSPAEAWSRRRAPERRPSYAPVRRVRPAGTRRSGHRVGTRLPWGVGVAAMVTDPWTRIRELTRETLHRAGRTPVLVRVPELAFLMVDGEGDPNTAVAYREAIEALYGLSYSLAFGLKRDLMLPVHVRPLEGPWWAEDPDAFAGARKGDWRWTAMIVQPEAVTPERLERARDELRQRKDPAALPRARLQRFEEGLAGQVLYLEPYRDEGPTIAQLHGHLRERASRSMDAPRSTTRCTWAIHVAAPRRSCARSSANRSCPADDRLAREDGADDSRPVDAPSRQGYEGSVRRARRERRSAAARPRTRSHSSRGGRATAAVAAGASRACRRRGSRGGRGDSTHRRGRAR
jgi:hypothetical protein